MAAVSQQLINAQKELLKRRKLAGVLVRPSIPAPAPVDTQQQIESLLGDATDTPGIPDTIRAYPTLLTAFLNNGIVPIGRIYLLLRVIDRAGRGWLDVDDLRQALTDKSSALYVCGWRRLRQILAQGDDVCWHRDRNGRIWLYSPVRIASVLGCGRLRGLAILLPVKSLLSGIQKVRASFYASFHAGRKDDNPISRKSLRNVTNVSQSSQRTYDRVAGIVRHVNYVLLKQYKESDLHEAYWKYGKGVFKFTDDQGMAGFPGVTYLARQLPNSYTVEQMQQTEKGRMKKINKQIDLVTNEVPGNDLKMVDRLYFSGVVQAGKSYNRMPEHDCYFPQIHMAKQHTTRYTVNLWRCLSAQI